MQEKSEMSPEEVMAGVEQMDSVIENIMEQVRAKEQEQLKAIFLRFCLRYGKMVDFSKVEGISQGNSTTYYYDFGGPNQYFLMKATFAIDPNDGPKLNIDYNSALVFNNEL